jgi:septal ring factor EnvC (AmiA/AmiB activator)
LDDKWALARKYGQYSAMAEGGKSVSGCPEVPIYVPDVTPSVEANPQIQIYNYIIQQTRTLVPEIIETQKEIKKTKQNLKEIKKDIAANRKETEQIVSKMIITKNEVEKDILKVKYKENNKEYDDLEEKAQEALKEAGDLNMKVDKQHEKVANLQEVDAAARANPERAKDFLENVR